MTKKFLSYKLAILIIISLGLILGSQINTATATGCSDKYPGGECKPACDTTATGADKEYEDTDTTLCSGSKCCHKLAAYPNIELQIPLPGIPGGSGPFTKAKSIVEYIAHLFALSLYIIIPLVIFMIILGGFKWILAAGNTSKIGEAKKLIYNSLLGLTISVLSYTLLSVVGLTSLEVPEVSYLGDEPTHGFAYWDPTSPTGWSNKPPSFIPPGGGPPPPPPPPGSGRGGGESPAPGYPNDTNCDGPAWEGLGCPGTTANIQVCFTNYYTPDDPTDGGLYKNEDRPERNFLCNVGMNCHCPTQSGTADARDTTYSCKDPYKTKPCRPFKPNTAGFKPGTDYCIGAKPPVIGNLSVAVDTTYFKYGCKFEIPGRPGPIIVKDTGGGIQGLHMDFFCGIGKDSCKTITAPRGITSIKILDLTSCYTSSCRKSPWVPPPPGSSGTYTHAEAMALLTAENITVSVSSGGDISATCPACTGANSCRPCTRSTVKTCTCACTSLEQIPKTAIDNVIKIQKADPSCDFRVTGGTEPCHLSHGFNLARIDLSYDTCLIDQLKNRGTYGITKIGTYRDPGNVNYNAVKADFVDGTAANAHFHLEW